MLFGKVWLFYWLFYNIVEIYVCFLKCWIFDYSFVCSNLNSVFIFKNRMVCFIFCLRICKSSNDDIIIIEICCIWKVSNNCYYFIVFFVFFFVLWCLMKDGFFMSLMGILILDDLR